MHVVLSPMCDFPISGECQIEIEVPEYNLQNGELRTVASFERKRFGHPGAPLTCRLFNKSVSPDMYLNPEITRRGRPKEALKLISLQAPVLVGEGSIVHSNKRRMSSVVAVTGNDTWYTYYTGTKSESLCRLLTP
jgi:hypothetical protein